MSVTKSNAFCKLSWFSFKWELGGKRIKQATCCWETLLCNTNGRLQHQSSGQCGNDILSCRSRAGSLDSMTNLLRLLLLWQSLNNSSEETEPNGPQMLVETKGFVNPIQKSFFLCSEITFNNSKFLKYKMGLSLSNNE